MKNKSNYNISSRDLKSFRAESKFVLFQTAQSLIPYTWGIAHSDLHLNFVVSA